MTTKKGWNQTSNERFFKDFGGKKDVYVKNVDRTREHNQRIVMSISMDVSPSIGEIYPEIIFSFNEIMIPSLIKVKKKYQRTLRVGATAFSDYIVPIWNGFENCDEIQDKRLTMETIKKTNPNGTALYQAMIETIQVAINAANQISKDEDTTPAKVKVLIVTDGANNRLPTDAREVRRITEELQDNRRVQLALAYFKTSHGLNRDQFNSMAKATGFFKENYYFDISSGTLEERKRSFRHFFGILSENMSKSSGKM